ncbi:HAD-IA family hydrolase [Winogradskya humida]|uniref:Sugar-phosphatase n=1 Tax=Winogradskya humida TaxID=113566 RepID=A0ABQ3ZY49_9ACTN|nr:HAD-IA family hydrolase [Actinoplanes humidus]GIE23535.1 hypothetical protein Ahu01nite_066370 [Actinoplanes humidus]
MIAVAGTAGSGKTTLGRALATALAAPLLDLDAITNPLLDALPADTLGGHWLAAPHRDAVRSGRYAALRSVTGDVVTTAGHAVLVAPFTAELRGGEEWELLRDAAGKAELHVVHLVAGPDLLDARRAQRAADRDQHRAPDVPTAPPAIPVITVDAELTTEQQLVRVLVALGRRTPIGVSNAVLHRDFDAVLFDLDGTLADSTASVLRSWRRFAAEIGIPARAVAENHGQPARHLLAKLLPPERVEAGLTRITDIEIADAQTLPRTPGALAFYESVPESRRAIVTSGAARLATARLHGAGIPVPPVMVTADDIRRGKPDPEPYLLAARRLGVDPQRCLAVEDAVAGIRSAKAAGCAVIAITGTSPADELHEADLIVDALDQLRVEATTSLRISSVQGVG